ncbi:hypothetical protein [Tahibacter amnicola]|uniref:Uncharacterized protein n=1 Tax=Tahibacter amnicola TaxID=2976241 RepID=A0ABY6BJ49_9GAMM|nr:hypothetical protein [Tahibacter amnicola]UXI69789.1 hypothetical protein N4264_09210 [Tahibacter amnicola]
MARIGGTTHRAPLGWRIRWTVSLVLLSGAVTGSTTDADYASCIAPLGITADLPYFPAVTTTCEKVGKPGGVQTATVSYSYTHWLPLSVGADYADFQSAAKQSMYTYVDRHLTAAGFRRTIEPRDDHDFGALAAEYLRDQDGDTVRAVLRATGSGATLQVERGEAASPPATLPPPSSAANFYDAEQVTRLFRLPGATVKRAGWRSNGNIRYDLDSLPADQWISPDWPRHTPATFIGSSRAITMAYPDPLPDVLSRYRSALAQAGWKAGVADQTRGLAGSYTTQGRTIEYLVRAHEQGATQVEVEVADPWLFQRHAAVAAIYADADDRYTFTPRFDAARQPMPDTLVQLLIAGERAQDHIDRGNDRTGGIAVFPALAESMKEDADAQRLAREAQEWAITTLVSRGFAQGRVRGFDTPVIAAQPTRGFQAGVSIANFHCWTDLDERADGPHKVCKCGNNRYREPFSVAEGACP